MANMAHILHLCTGTPAAVMVITVIVYLAISIPLVVIHEIVPPAPSKQVLFNGGLNLTEAWLDLAELTNGYRPYNSRRNDDVHDWLLRRIEGILAENDISWSNEMGHISTAPQLLAASEVKEKQAGKGEIKPFTGFIDVETGEQASIKQHNEKEELRKRTNSPLVTIFNDLQSNVTCSGLGNLGSSGQGRLPGQSVYFEGTNIIVYIRGTEDEEGEWWKTDLSSAITHGQGGVLVSAHYDSVSTGFGATDDGVGVITILQLIRYFTTFGNRPKKGIVALLNNGEEDFLNGARAFTQHPMSLFTHTFLNLEGAGAGGRAVLFRTTDTEVTRAYAQSRNPFGTVVAADGFKQGFIRSQTDYIIFDEVLGLRGLDVAFWAPRARYHTDQDDIRHTSVDSIWHMLSAALTTVKSLTSDTSDTFNSPRSDRASGKVKNGNGSDGVWFDLFGKGFAVFGLRTLFAWSVTFLVACPLAIALIIYLLVQQDKFYYFSASTLYDSSSEEGELITLDGWKGAFRWPIILIIATGLTVGSGLLIAKVNPLIVYSSPYAVWAMMLTLNFCVFWFIMRGTDFVRPSALSRGYVYMWMFVLSWAILVAVTVFEDQYDIASGYMLVFFEIAIFFALFISLCELFVLPTKSQYAEAVHGQHEARDGAATEAPPDSDALISPLNDSHPSAEPAETAPEPSETTPLIGGNGATSPHPPTLTSHLRRSLGASTTEGGTDALERQVSASYRRHFQRLSSLLTQSDQKPYGNEQGWSGRLPRWTWLVQFLLVGPIMLILAGQVGLFIVTATAQTGADGSSLTAPYLLVAVFTVLLLLPTTATVHRFTWHVPTFLFLVFIGTLIYNLAAFPFSANNRYKAYFQQTVDLDTGANNVTFSGLEAVIRPIIAAIPSAAGQTIECETRAYRSGVKFCTYTGIPPAVVPETPYADWLSFNVTRHAGTNSATFSIAGRNTRACVIRFARAVKGFHVAGAGSDERFDAVPASGSEQIKLWHRRWEEAWEVDVEWPMSDGRKIGEEGMEGRVVCLWSDGNAQGVIPALDEARRYVPAWVGISKLNDGLVEGSKPFSV